MFRTIVAGCNGYDRGRSAVRFASILAGATSARLVVAAVHYEPLLPFPVSFRERVKEIDRALRQVCDELAPNATTTTVEALSPAHALRHVADREHADLIVVGSRHRSGMDRVVEVDHALQVLHGSPSAVAVVPDGAEVGAGLEQIMVGIDGSPESRAALALAVDLARRAGARLRLQVIVDDHLPAWATVAPGFVQPVDWSAMLESRRKAASELLERSLAGVKGVPADGDVAVGHTARELASIGESADLMVLGSRHWGPLGRLALGSTSEAVVRRAADPVLVLPRGATGSVTPESAAARAAAP